MDSISLRDLDRNRLVNWPSFVKVWMHLTERIFPRILILFVILMETSWSATCNCQLQTLRAQLGTETDLALNNWYIWETSPVQLLIIVTRKIESLHDSPLSKGNNWQIEDSRYWKSVCFSIKWQENRFGKFNINKNFLEPSHVLNATNKQTDNL